MRPRLVRKIRKYRKRNKKIHKDFSTWVDLLWSDVDLDSQWADRTCEELMQMLLSMLSVASKKKREP
jgi:hypothetical protein